MGKHYNQFGPDQGIEPFRHHDAETAPSEIARSIFKCLIFDAKWIRLIIVPNA